MPRVKTAMNLKKITRKEAPAERRDKKEGEAHASQAPSP
jgi:hypothetical protein